MVLMKKLLIGFLVLLAALGAGAGAYAGYALGMFDDPASNIAIGADMPGFTMTDHTGEEHALSDYAGEIVVLNFASHKCPFSRGVDPDLAEIAREYADKGVVVLGIDSHYATPREELAEYVAEENIPWPLLKDENHAYADQVGVKRTPEIFILDTEGALVYHGGFDGRRSTTGPGPEPYVDQALAALVAGEPIETKQTKAWGCTIKRDD